MYDELEYIEDFVNPDGELFRSSYHGNKKPCERAVMRLFVDGRRVVVPSGFGGEVKTPKDARSLYRVQADASDGAGLRDRGRNSPGSCLSSGSPPRPGATRWRSADVETKRRRKTALCLV